MFRTTATYCITMLLLLTNIQAAIADVVETFHTDVKSISLSVDASEEADMHESDTHCQHCCHAHASNIVVNETTAQPCLLVEPEFYLSIIYDGLPSGPPTPPPNA